MALKAGRVGVAPDQVDPRGELKNAGLTPEQSAKLDKALVSPLTAPLENELVGVGTGNDQIMVKIGDGLELDGETSPYTLKAAGGGVSIDLLWTNSDQSVDFSETVLTIQGILTYKYLMIDFNDDRYNYRRMVNIFPANVDSVIQCRSAQQKNYQRRLKTETDKLTFYYGYKYDTAQTRDDAVCIPVKVYGIKF